MIKQEELDNLFALVHVEEINNITFILSNQYLLENLTLQQEAKG